jgi:rubrerythrin
VFWKHLEGGDVEITAAFPAGLTGNTLENLQAAAEGEKMEWGTLYPDFAQTAHEEGFEAIAQSFEEVAEVEEWHERRYNVLAERMAQGQVFKRDEPIRWHCRNCGYVMEGPEPPEVCPACQHARAYYQPYPDNF